MHNSDLASNIDIRNAIQTIDHALSFLYIGQSQIRSKGCWTRLRYASTMQTIITTYESYKTSLQTFENKPPIYSKYKLNSLEQLCIAATSLAVDFTRIPKHEQRLKTIFSTTNR